MARRVTETVEEVFIDVPGTRRVTEVVEEAFIDIPGAKRISQVAEEVFIDIPGTRRVSQLVMEVFVPDFNPVGDEFQALWDVQVPVGDASQIVWDDRTAVGDAIQLVWDVAAETWVNLVKFGLTDMGDPGVNFDHVLRVRARKTDIDHIGVMRVRLMEGTTEIAGFEENL